MAGDVLGAAVGAGSAKIGRYFTVVSALPSAVFVAYVYVLVESGGWRRDVDFGRAVEEFDLKNLAFLGMLSFIASLALHHLQFTLIQTFEGYWGLSAPARYLALLRSRYHRRRWFQLKVRHDAAVKAVEELPEGAGPSSPGAPDTTLRNAIIAQETGRLLGDYPVDPRHVLPTRLGSVLRRYEVDAGAPYGLSVIPSLPRFGMVASEREVEYIENQRVQLELAIRTAALALLAAVLTVIVMWQHSGWLFLALGPYLVAYLSYRGAIVVAHEYGTAMAVMIELNRFPLYERLHLPVPDNLGEELKQNKMLMHVLRLLQGGSLDYSHPTSSPGPSTSRTVE